MGHGVQLPPVLPRPVAQVQHDIAPAGRAGQRRHRVAVLGRRLRLELGHLRQQDRQLRLRQRQRPVLVVDDRERLAPVPLPGELPVPQPVGPGSPPVPGLLQPRDRARYVTQPSRIDLPDRQPHDLGKLPVPRVVGRDRHDRAGPVPSQHVVREIDRDRFPGGRIDRRPPGRHPGLGPDAGRPLPVTEPRRRLLVGPHRRPHALRRIRDQLADQRMFRRQHQIGRPGQRVRPRREHLDRPAPAPHRPIRPRPRGTSRRPRRWGRSSSAAAA